MTDRGGGQETRDGEHPAVGAARVGHGLDDGRSASYA